MILENILVLMFGIIAFLIITQIVLPFGGIDWFQFDFLRPKKVDRKKLLQLELRQLEEEIETAKIRRKISLKQQQVETAFLQDIENFNQSSLPAKPSPTKSREL